MSKKEKSDLFLEIIGGIYTIEKFKDGKEIRSEIPGETVLKILMMCLEKQIEIEVDKKISKRK